MASVEPQTELDISDNEQRLGTPTNIRDYDYKIFRDPVHGHIKLHPLCVKIVDTPQFQRLRNIKKLGGIYFVYPGASHNQFEHALGTCYLAGEMVRSLRSAQPEFDITEEDILCVEIAGLCRNLGCAPFSDVFYNSFLSECYADGKPPKICDVSVKMMEHMIQVNDIPLSHYMTRTDETFIKEIIAGTKPGVCKSRSEKKRFLYQIVAPYNLTRTEMWDVAFWDSLARDSYHVGIRSPFDHWRLIKFSRVIEDPMDTVEGVPLTKICYREKEVYNLYDMLHAHQILTRKAVLHKTVISIEKMITESFLAVEKSSSTECDITVGGRTFKMSKCIDDMRAFERLDDAIFQKIFHSTGQDEWLKSARDTLEKLQKRDIYKHLGGTKPNSATSQRCTEDDVKQMQQQMIESEDIDKHFFLKLVDIDYGKADKDPMEAIRFYRKKAPNRPIKITRDDVSHMLPEHFQDQMIFLYSRTKDQTKQELATKAFKNMCSKNAKLLEAKCFDSPRQTSESGD